MPFSSQHLILNCQKIFSYNCLIVKLNVSREWSNKSQNPLLNDYYFRNETLDSANNHNMNIIKKSMYLIA